MSYEKQGTGYDPGAAGYELQGRDKAPSPATAPADGLEVVGWDDLARKLRGFGKAYSEDLFSAVLPLEREWLHKERPGLQDRIAADMGRHLAKFMDEAADAIDAAYATIKGLEAECRLSMQTIADERARAEAAEARIKALEEALRPFAEYTTADGDGFDDEFFRIHDDHPLLGEGLGDNWKPAVTVGDMRRARSTLNGGNANG